MIEQIMNQSRIRLGAPKNPQHKYVSEMSLLLSTLKQQGLLLRQFLRLNLTLALVSGLAMLEHAQCTQQGEIRMTTFIFKAHYVILAARIILSNNLGLPQANSMSVHRHVRTAHHLPAYTGVEEAEQVGLPSQDPSTTQFAQKCEFARRQSLWKKAHPPPD